MVIDSYIQKSSTVGPGTPTLTLKMSPTQYQKFEEDYRKELLENPTMEFVWDGATYSGITKGTSYNGDTEEILFIYSRKGNYTPSATT
jgi:hypothetical protein